MVKIRNLKTEESTQQIKDAWLEVAASKNRLLASTDWTQLKDISLHNEKKFSTWRKKLRDLDLKATFETPQQAKSFLEDYKKTIPKPNWSSEVEQANTENDLKEELQSFCSEKIERDIHEAKLESSKQEEQPNLKEELQSLIEEKVKLSNAELLNEIYLSLNQPEEAPEPMCVNHDEALNILKKAYRKAKNDKLLEVGVLDHTIITEKLNQAGDFLSGDDSIENYPLLIPSTDIEDPEDHVKDLLKECKQYFNRLYSIEKEFANMNTTLYTMTNDEIVKELESYGHRHRLIQ